MLLVLSRSTVGFLSRPVDVDERALRHYISHLIDLKVPVRSVRGSHGGYRLTPRFRLPPLMFTDDAVAVLLGLVAARQPITVAIDSTDATQVQLHVIDGRPGIDRERSERIFGRFAQGNPSRSGRNDGSGLGLAIARENVLLHGGTIDVSHTPPTCFTVRLPLAGSQQTRPAIVSDE